MISDEISLSKMKERKREKRKNFAKVVEVREKTDYGKPDSIKCRHYNI
jgi:hypothetical protein